MLRIKRSSQINLPNFEITTASSLNLSEIHLFYCFLLCLIHKLVPDFALGAHFKVDIQSAKTDVTERSQGDSSRHNLGDGDARLCLDVRWLNFLFAPFAWNEQDMVQLRNKHVTHNMSLLVYNSLMLAYITYLFIYFLYQSASTLSLFYCNLLCMIHKTIPDFALGAHFKEDIICGESVGSQWWNWKRLGWRQQMVASGTERLAYAWTFDFPSDWENLEDE